MLYKKKDNTDTLKQQQPKPSPPKNQQNGSSSFVPSLSQPSLQQQQLKPRMPGRETQALEAPQQVRRSLHRSALPAGPQDACAPQPPPLRSAPPSHPADPASPAPRRPTCLPRRAPRPSPPRRWLRLPAAAPSCSGPQPRQQLSAEDRHFRGRHLPTKPGRRRGGAVRTRDSRVFGHELRAPASCSWIHSTAA